MINSELETAVDIHSLCATTIMVVGGCYTFYALRRMHHRFHRMSPDEMNLRPSLPFVQEMSGQNGQASVLDDEDKEILKNARPDGRGGGAHAKGAHAKMTGESRGHDDSFATKLKKFSMLGAGGLSDDELKASVSQPPQKINGDDQIHGDDQTPTDFHGYLHKKSSHAKGFQYLHGDPWKSRWCVLANGRLGYYNTEEEWKAGKPPRNETKPILMGAYEVMVNPRDYEWGFMLESIGGIERDWEFRADSEKMR